MNTDVLVPPDFPGVKFWDNVYELGSLHVKKTN